MIEILDSIKLEWWSEIGKKKVRGKFPIFPENKYILKAQIWTPLFSNEENLTYSNQQDKLWYSIYCAIAVIYSE